MKKIIKSLSFLTIVFGSFGCSNKSFSATFSITLNGEKTIDILRQPQITLNFDDRVRKVTTGSYSFPTTQTPTVSVQNNSYYTLNNWLLNGADITSKIDNKLYLPSYTLDDILNKLNVHSENNEYSFVANFKSVEI